MTGHSKRSQPAAWMRLGRVWVVALITAVAFGLAAPAALAQDEGEAAVVPPELVSDPPQVTGVAARRGLAYDVVVELTIGVDGVPKDVAVVEGPGGAWTAAIVTAVEATRFSPATRGGEAFEVRVRIPLSVGDSPSWRAGPRRRPERTPVPKGVPVSGRVLERGSRAPVAGVPVLVEGSDAQAITEADGTFLFESLPEGRAVLVVPELDYKEARARVEVPSDEPVTIRVTPLSVRRYRSVVKGKPRDAARVVVSVEQAREVPGSSGDPVKVVENLPGVARPAAAGPGAGQLVIRGSAPEDTKFYVDGLPLFQVFHFGGLYSVVQDEWIDAIDYRPGGFSLEYGDATGGFLGVNLADIASDGVHGHIDVNIYHAAALLTVPITDDLVVGAAFRRSYFDAILGAVFADSDALSFTTAPRYYDYQVQAQWQPSERTSLRVLLFGSDDLISLVTNEPSDSDPSQSGFSLGRWFHQIQATLRHQVAPDLSLYAGLATSYQQLELEPSRQSSFKLTFDPVTVRTDLAYTGVPDLEIRGGLQATATRFKVEANIPQPTKEGQVPLPLGAQDFSPVVEQGVGGLVSLWTDATYDILPELSLMAGLRFNAYIGNFDEFTLDPRAQLTWEATDTTRVIFAGGWNHQAPTPDETSETFGTPSLGPERAAYVNVGVSQSISDYLTIDVQGFYKYLDRLVAPTNDFFGDSYANSGTGYVVGGELMARLNTAWVDGWVSYTLSRSRRTDAPGLEERAFSFDQTHVLALVLGVKLPDNWRIGARFRYTTGNPFTPLTASYFDSASDTYVAAPAKPGVLTDRVQDFLQLDVRVDKRFIFDTWELWLYLELVNATNQANVEAVGYNFDFTERQDTTGLPIYPSLGIRASW